MTKTQKTMGEDAEEFACKFTDEQQELADADEAHVLVYMANAHGGILKPSLNYLSAQTPTQVSVKKTVDFKHHSRGLRRST